MIARLTGTTVRTLLAALLLFGAAAPSAYAQGPAPLVEDGSDLRHPASGYRFPEQIGAFRRSAFRTYAPDNFSVRYGSFADDMSEAYFDIFIYPATVPLTMEAAGVEQALTQHMNAQRIEQAEADATPDRLEGWFDGTFQERLVTTGYVLGLNRGWVIKVRATSPRDADQLATLRDAVAAVDFDGIIRAYKARP